MIGKNCNFYVKKMQKSVIVLFGVFWLVIFCAGCTKKEDESLMLLSLEEAEEENGELAEAVSPDLQMAETDLETMPYGAQKTKEAALVEEEAELCVCVHVCGAVQNPGVYELPDGSRVYEAVELAGGFTGEADCDYVNRAQVLPDGAKLVIPTKEEVEALSKEEQTVAAYGILQDAQGGSISEDALGNTEAGLVNINTAGKSELLSLPGIGETRAEAILTYRREIGVFTSKEQLMEIDGIKDGLYSKIQDKICVE